MMLKQTITRKMVDQGRSDFCIVFTMSLCALELKQTFRKFAISNHTAFTLGFQTLRSYLELTYEYELHLLPNTKVSAIKDHGENFFIIYLEHACLIDQQSKLWF